MGEGERVKRGVERERKKQKMYAFSSKTQVSGNGFGNI